jgi:hypothetical protein
MRRQWRLCLLALSLALGASSNILAQDPAFTTIDFAGADLTLAFAINPHGDIVGAYRMAGVRHGYLLSGGEFTSLDFPGASSTEAGGINPRGDIVGDYTLAGVSHGFLLSRRERDEDEGDDGCARRAGCKHRAR